MINTPGRKRGGNNVTPKNKNQKDRNKNISTRQSRTKKADPGNVGRREMTIEDEREQLKQREEEKEKLKGVVGQKHPFGTKRENCRKNSKRGGRETNKEKNRDEGGTEEHQKVSR